MRVLYIGTGDIGLPALRWLLDSGHETAAVITQPDKPAGRRMELTAPPVKQLAVERGLRVYQPARMRAEESVALVKSLEAELIVVMAYGQILPKEVLDAARVACVNLHASILPRHRGAAPIQAAILSGDTETGITVMYMDEGLDTGDILLVRRVQIGPEDTGGTLHDRLAEAAPGALAEAITLLEAGSAPRTRQDAALATLTKKLSREDGEMRWERSSAELERQVRAMNPWPGAFTVLPEAGGKRIKIFAAKEVAGSTGAAGEVLSAGADGILVGCGTGALLLCELQLEGKRRLAAREFLAGTRVERGAILGASHANDS